MRVRIWFPIAVIPVFAMGCSGETAGPRTATPILKAEDVKITIGADASPAPAAAPAPVDATPPSTK